MPPGPKPKNFTGHQYGCITILDFSHKSGSHRFWKCACQCGKTSIVRQDTLTTGHKRSLGCAMSDRKNNLTHGKRYASEYQSWASMKQRCLNPNNPSYARYGGRGIYICKEWQQSFAAFYADMGPRPHSTSLDRRNNDGPYSPENCRWVGATTQAKNRRKAPHRTSHPNSLRALREHRWSKGQKKTLNE